MTAEQPAPPLSYETTILSFDVESNGLHGPAFAVGAVLMKLDGTIVAEFKARSPIRGEVDPWVQQNVLPALADYPKTHPNPKAMRTAFWHWFVDAKQKADYVIVKNGYPVEARFLTQCQDDDLDTRYWDHSFPILELASLLIQVGIKPLAVTYRLVEDQLGDKPNLQHNPYWDAWVTGLAAAKAFKLSGRLA